jgi:hypothetical protein
LILVITITRLIIEIDDYLHNKLPALAMQIIFDFNTALNMAVAAKGVMFGAIILYFGFKCNPSNQPLGLHSVISNWLFGQLM